MATKTELHFLIITFYTVSKGAFFDKSYYVFEIPIFFKAHWPQKLIKIFVIFSNLYYLKLNVDVWVWCIVF